MFRHEDVAVNVELMALSATLKDVEEYGAGVVVVKIGKTPIATEGDEVVVTKVVVSLQTARHVGDDTWGWWMYWHPHPAHTAKCAS